MLRGFKCEVSKYLAHDFFLDFDYDFILEKHMFLKSKFEKLLFFKSCRSIVVLAGLLRIFGREIPEQPIVATSKDN